MGGGLNCFRRAESGNRVVQANHSEPLPYPPNRISNTKYNVLTFLPKNLWEQFSRAMNRYFLIIACLQLIKTITPVNPLTTWAPLAVIFAVTAAKEALDDWGRAKADAVANNRKYSVVRGGRRVEIRSAEIVVGDIVRLQCNDEVPCDLVILSSSDSKGNCFIQTTNLDGETNLKVRSALAQTSVLTNEAALGGFKGVIQCAAPNEHIYKFDSQLKMTPNSAEVLPLSSSQLLLQATHLRNTDWVFGLAVYTGNETKFGKNKKTPPTKYTRTDAFINNVSAVIFIFQLLLVLIFGIIGNNWNKENGLLAWYLDLESNPPGYDVVIIPARFLLLNSTMIPISLKLTIDLAKLSYARFINADLVLVEKESRMGVISNSTALSEDLGQIKYVLTDKTGTLTDNRMVLKVVTVLAREYGEVDNLGGNHLDPVHPVPPSSDALPHTPALPIRTPGGGALPPALAKGASIGIMADMRLYKDVMADYQSGSRQAGCLEFLRCLALNNDVVPDVTDDGTRHYKASSPDEEALVKAAQSYGVTLWEREGEATVLDVHGVKERYLQLACFEFSSDRKRMSVILRDPATQRLRVYCKGADDVIMKRLAPGQEELRIRMQAQIDKYAAAGLRTLVMTYRDMSEQEYQQFKLAYDAAASDMVDRDAAKERVYTTVERDLVLIGATAIEDKLQDGVPDTIGLLKKAGISFWMCTGDKFSTALTIARTCNLKPNGNLLIEIEGETEAEVRKSIDDATTELARMGYNLHYHKIPTGWSALLSTMTFGCLGGKGAQAPHRTTQGVVSNNPLAKSVVGGMQPFTVIVRGSTLDIALGPLHDRFGAICLSADSVICCRVTPKQKGLLVRLVNLAGHLTLAIGDGGNDVAMIQEAAVGIGIRGKEGLQAARASDYQVPYFRALQRLLLVHGRYSYYRTAIIAQYSFYKSFLFCVMQIGFGFFSGYAGVSLFNSLCVAAYNVVVFVPIVFFVVDRDITQMTALTQPQAYLMGSEGTLMTGWTMLLWFLRGLWQAVVILLFGLYGSSYSASGDYESMGLLIYFAYSWVQDFTMLLLLRRFTWINLLTIFGMHALAFGGMFAVNLTTAFRSFIDVGSLSNAIMDPSFWLQHLLVTLACIVPVETVKIWSAAFGRSFASRLYWLDSDQEKRVGSREAARAGGVGVAFESNVYGESSPYLVRLGKQPNELQSPSSSKLPLLASPSVVANPMTGAPKGAGGRMSDSTAHAVGGVELTAQSFSGVNPLARMIADSGSSGNDPRTTIYARTWDSSNMSDSRSVAVVQSGSVVPAIFSYRPTPSRSSISELHRAIDETKIHPST